MPFADLRGQRFRYEDTGAGDRVVVFSHGILMDHTMFAPQVAEFSSDHRVITWDWRGFGETITDGSPFTIWDQVDDLLALLDRLGVERAVFAGMSHGGYITMRTPLVAPDRVEAIIAMDTNSSGMSAEDQQTYRTLFDVFLEQGPTDDICATFADIIIGDPVLNAEWIKRWQARMDWSGIRHPIDVTITLDDITGRLPEITCPALVIHGIDDKAFDTARAANIAEHLANAGPAVLVPGGHAANLTDPAGVNAAIRSFLRAL
ncbi:alpha/beta hydrolase fold protein [Mycolicibacterium rhodesiae JS60]|nr:alpha/beta hydrolase fold protein [Mycolicibacterium rhodesiae JS60]